MHIRTTSVGSRQRLWDALRGGQAIRTDDLYERTATNPNSARPYLRALECRGYLDVQEAQEGRALIRTVRLAKDTGPRAPSWSVHSDEFRDWNIEPPMSGDQLCALVAASGYGLTDWLRAIDKHPSYATRIRQMMNGQRPVSDGVADAARSLFEPKVGV